MGKPEDLEPGPVNGKQVKHTGEKNYQKMARKDKMEVMIVQLLYKGVAEDFDDMLDELGGLGKSK